MCGLGALLIIAAFSDSLLKMIVFAKVVKQTKVK